MIRNLFDWVVSWFLVAILGVLLIAANVAEWWDSENNPENRNRGY